MSTGSFDTKERVKQAVDIVDLVGSHIQLRRQGRNYVGLCPWHDDTRPSLQVNPERQSFKCWVCDIGGDVFSFVMKMEGVEFREALQMLADRAGIPVEKPHRQHAAASGASGEAAGGSQDTSGLAHKPVLLQAMAWAEKQYHKCLLEAPEAEAARRYLQQRGITAESIERFHLGFSPLDRDWILRQAGGKGDRSNLPERPGGCFAQIGPVPFSAAGDHHLGRDVHARPRGRPTGRRAETRPDLSPAAGADPPLR